MIYLDTHVVVWLYAGKTSKFNQSVKTLINEQELLISPIVRLELQYLYEIERITDEANTILTDLGDRIGLKQCDKPFHIIVSNALLLSWTRDPFDRLIVANAALNDDILISKDQTIRNNYAHAKW
ncbi:MAG: PIN domain-containing protein [Chloroflexi bacterium]|nr:PIN domain-containing protein [Chloroflexota bacterium]